MTVRKFTFEELFTQNKKRIHYHIHKLGIQDPHYEYYGEGLYALWMAYKKYEPDKGPMSTYFNFTIRNQLIDKIRKQTRESTNLQDYIANKQIELNNASRNKKNDLPVIDKTDIELEAETLFERVRPALTEKQQKFIFHHYIQGFSIQEIAFLENTTIEAVKSWGKEARKKLRKSAIV